jgi:subtilisin family serine protease
MIDGPDEHLVRYANEWMYGGAGSDSGNEIDICALGHLTPTVQFSGCFMTGAGKCIFSGTSAAAPEVAAAASLILSADPMLSWVGVKKILRNTADIIDLPGGGWSGGRSLLYGSGRLNACEAIRSALVGKGLMVPNDACK